MQISSKSCVATGGRAVRGVLVAVVSIGLAANGCSKREPQKDAGKPPSKPEPTPTASEWQRGLLVMTPGQQTFRACDDSLSAWVEDATGGQLGFAFEQMGTGPERPIYVEIQATPTALPAQGPGATFPKAFRVTAMRRASFANEGGGCDEARATWEFRAHGNEPFWSVTVTRQIIVFAQPDDPTRLEFPYVPAVNENGRLVYRTSIESPAKHTLELVIEEKRCTDTMAGEISPYTAQAKLDGKPLHGCATDGDLAPSDVGAEARTDAGPVVPSRKILESKPDPPAGEATTPAKNPEPSQLQYLTLFVGHTPADVGLWQTQPFAGRLHALVGAGTYPDLLVNLQEPQPIGAENGIVYLLGNKMLSAATESAAVVVDTKRDVLYVWLKHDGEIREFIENGQTITLPEAVRKAILSQTPRP